VVFQSFIHFVFIQVADYQHLASAWQ